VGWRYLIFAIGGLTLLSWVVRFFAFPLYESPRFLVGQGRDGEAVNVLRSVARYNGVEDKVEMSEEMLKEAGREAGETEETETGVLAKNSKWNFKHVKALFATRKMAFSTSVLIALWGQSLCHATSSPRQRPGLCYQSIHETPD
jgi:hypothetical protein